MYENYFDLIYDNLIEFPHESIVADNLISMLYGGNQLHCHYVKYATIRVFSNPYFPVFSHILRRV